MPLSGMAFGAAEGLEDIVARRIERQKLEAAIAEQMQRDELARASLEQRRIEEQHRVTERQRDDDRLDADRRQRTNMQGVRRMMGEAITQGTGELTDQDRRGLAALQVEAGDEPSMLPQPKKPIQYTYTDPKTGGKSIRFANPDAGPIDLGNEPAKPEKPQVYNVGNGTLVDGNGKVIYQGGNANAVDPAKAREKGTAMLDAARSLRKHPGLGSLTGARIGNPDYALGVQQTPIAGTKAADAGAYFNQLKSLFTLDNIGLLKGVLSDSDMKILQQASTSLDTAMQDETFVAELDRVIQKLETAFGQPQAGGGLAPMNPMSSHGATPAVDPRRVDELIKRYGGGGV